ncbi:MAG: peptide deformylase [Bacteroidetes bacterium SB0662_bin_6]|nr:peptide deformylase [Bacteroidetes bacterium SB0668_bin_1]MYE04343.1 peptide deformylase [Bacteroidetes bacterium SB0662_bin_6]
MILPIRLYGDPVLRNGAEDVAGDSASVQQLIDDMIETMRGASGIGLAAPQVGRTERIFVADLAAEIQFEPVPEEASQPMAFINPEIIWESEEEGEFEEGCLSIPDITEAVKRSERIRLTYLDRHFQPQELEVGELPARVIQHEVDHLEGIFFVDRISAFRRRLLRRKLRDVASGKAEADYPLYAGTK